MASGYTQNNLRFEFFFSCIFLHFPDGCFTNIVPVLKKMLEAQLTFSFSYTSQVCVQGK